MPADVAHNTFSPKRIRRFLDPALPGKTQKLGVGKSYLQMPDAAIDKLDNYDDGRPGPCYELLADPPTGLTPTWSDIADGGLIDGATKFSAGEHQDPMTFSFDVTFATNSAGLLLKLGNDTTGGVSLGLLTGGRLAAVVGASDADKVERTVGIGAKTSVTVTLAFNPVGGADAENKLKVWIDGLEVISVLHPYTEWQGAFDDDGGFHRTEADQLDLDAPNAIGGTAATNTTILSNLTYYANQLPAAF